MQWMPFSAAARRERAARRSRAAAVAALRRTYRELHANEAAFQHAQERFAVEQLIYEHAALECRCRALLQELRGGDDACPRP